MFLLNVVLVLQIIALIGIIYDMIEKRKESKKFWAKQLEISEEFLKHTKTLSEHDGCECECEKHESEE